MFLIDANLINVAVRSEEMNGFAVKVTYVRESTEETEKVSKWNAELIENVQFIYELALAELEPEAFGVDFAVTNSLREFVLRSPPDIGVTLIFRKDR